MELRRALRLTFRCVFFNCMQLLFLVFGAMKAGDRRLGSRKFVMHTIKHGIRGHGFSFQAARDESILCVHAIYNYYIYNAGCLCVSQNAYAYAHKQTIRFFRHLGSPSLREYATNQTNLTRLDGHKMSMMMDDNDDDDDRRVCAWPAARIGVVAKRNSCLCFSLPPYHWLWLRPWLCLSRLCGRGVGWKRST